MSTPSAPKQGVMSLAVKDKNILYKSYMPFVKGGGIFIPTEKQFELGDEVFLLLTLLDDPERFPVTGKVVWITPRGSTGNRPMGVGIQFIGADGINVQRKIETNLAGALGTGRATYTM